MSVIVYIILLLLSGLVVGALGRLALPGPDPMTIGQTILVGIGGSLIAGVVWWALVGHGAPGILLSVLGATLIVYLIRRRRGGSLTRPGRYP